MRKILIVEDEEMLRDTYQIILSTEPYDIHVAANGKEALEKSQRYNYDLILLDLMMPVMDGPTFLQAYKSAMASAERTSKVIILSNLSYGDELTRALELGASRNVLKASLSPKQLIAMVRYELEAT